MKKARANVQHTAEINVGPKWVGEKKRKHSRKKRKQHNKKAGQTTPVSGSSRTSPHGRGCGCGCGCGWGSGCPGSLCTNFWRCGGQWTVKLLLRCCNVSRKRPKWSKMVQKKEEPKCRKYKKAIGGNGKSELEFPS